MKILYFGSVFSPYQNSFWKECEKYCEIESLYLSAQQQGHQWNLPGKDNVINLNYYKNKIKAYKVIFTKISAQKIEILIIGGYKMPMSLFAILVGFLFRKKVLLWLERPIRKGRFIFLLRSAYLMIIKLFLSGALVIGEDAKKDYKKYFKSVFNLPYSFQINKFISKKESEINTLNFIFIGQYISRKGVLELIEGFKECKNKEIRLTLAGGGILHEEINKQIKGIKNIENIGYVDYQDVPDILNRHDVFILPSRHDGWAVVICEAMAAGLFVVGTKFTSACNEYIVEKENGLFVEVDSKSIGNKIQWCVENKQKVYRGGLQNQNIIKESMSNAEVAAKKLVAFVESI